MINIQEILAGFRLPEGERTAEPFGNGHINHTYRVRIAGAEEQYILQRINSYVFKRPREVMENMQRVTEYLQERIREEGGDPERETLRLVPARSGACWTEDGEGEVWRLLLFVPDTVSPQLPDDLGVLEECGRAFGCFSRRLKDCPAARLPETIPAFHDTPVRLRQLEEAAERDACGRLKDVGPEMDFARSREAETRILTDALAAGKLPLRVTHNDTKVNNVMLDMAARGWDKDIENVGGSFNMDRSTETQKDMLVALGFQRDGSPLFYDPYLDRITYRLGGWYKTWYVKDVYELGGSLGAGFPLGRKGTTLDLSFQGGKRFADSGRAWEELFFGFRIGLMGVGTWGQNR